VVRWILLTFCVVVLLGRNFPWHLDDKDQAKQAYVSGEILFAEGSLLYQELPQGGFATKPPGMAWLSAGLYYVTLGNMELAWRLPSILATLGTLALLMWAGHQINRKWGGILAACAFSINMLSPRLATLVRTDSLLALITLVIGLWIYLRLRRGPDSTISWRQDALFMLPLLAFGLFTKGPVLLAFLLPGLVLYTIVERDRGHLRRAWGTWWVWIVAMIPFVAWGIWGSMSQPGFFNQVVGDEFLARFEGGEEATHNVQPVFFYVGHLLHKWGPWSILLILCLITDRTIWGQLLSKPETKWLACWILGGLLFMSLVPSKRLDRIFPLIPPMVLLLVHLIHLNRCPQRRRALIASTAFACLAFGLYFLVDITGNYRSDDRRFTRFCQTIAREIAPHGQGLITFNDDHEALKAYLPRTHDLEPNKATLKRLEAGDFDGMFVFATEEELPLLAAHGLEIQNPIIVGRTPGQNGGMTCKILRVSTRRG